MSRPFFSVVIDNHNYGRFLRQAIDSVLGQDFPEAERELIVVDDGSTDDSREILASYGSRLRPVLQVQQGQATAFNRGFSEARGEVVCLLDSDDWWTADKLKLCAEPFKDPKVGAVQHYLEDRDAAGPLPQFFPDWPARYALGDFLDARTHFAATSGMSIRKKLLVDIPRDLFYYLDDYLTARALFDSELANLPKVLGFHRIHGANWCAGGFEDPRKLERDFEMRKIYAAALARWLAERKLDTTARFKSLDAAESWRRRVLHAALTADPRRAFELWWEKADRSFRSWTLFLAVLSPALYLSAYRLYARLRAFMRK